MNKRHLCEIGSIAIKAAHRKECMLQIYDDELILHTGCGPDRKTYCCNINNIRDIKKMRKLLK